MECKWEQDPYYLYEIPIKYVSKDDAKKVSMDCVTAHQTQYKKWIQYPKDYQNPDTYMAENEPLCKERERNWPQLDKCLSKKGITQPASHLWHSAAPPTGTVSINRPSQCTY